MKKSKYIVDYESIDGNYYLLNTGNGSMVAVSQDKKNHLLHILNHSEEYSNQKVFDHLCELGFFIPDDRDEFQETVGKYILRDFCEKNYLEITIMPTEQCNFRCVYCYEDFKKPKMTEDVQNGLIRYVEREIKHHKGLVVSWFGGEPLLAMDVIENLSKAFMDICKRNCKIYSASMTTNGYLLSFDMFEKLRLLHVRHFQITVDGNKDTHDRQRVFVGGGPTYDRIMCNLMSICKNSTSNLWSISLRTNVTNNIIKNVARFKNDVIQQFGADRRIYIMLRKMWTNDTPEADSLLCADQEFECFVEKCHISENSLYQEYLFSYGMNFCCYASNPNAFVFGADGIIYKCTYALYDDVNKVGHIRKDGAVEFDKEKLSFWIAPYVGKDAECQSCANFGACVSRGCPYKQKQGCSQKTLEVLKYYFPQFFKLAQHAVNLTDVL